MSGLRIENEKEREMLWLALDAWKDYCEDAAENGYDSVRLAAKRWLPMTRELMARLDEDDS